MKSFGGTALLTEVKSSSIKCFDFWKSAGRPTEGPIFDAKCEAHREYNKSVKLAKSNSNKMISDNLQKNLLETNIKKCWRCWQGYFKNNDTNRKIKEGGFNENF